MTIGGNFNNIDPRTALFNNLALQNNTQNTAPSFADLIAAQANTVQNTPNLQNNNGQAAAQIFTQLPAGNIVGIGDFSAANVADYSNSLAYIAGASEEVAQVGYQSAESSAYYSYLDAVNNYYGQVQQDQLNEYSNRANVALDLEQLALRNNYGIMQKQMEMYVLDAQVNEKLMGTFFEIEKVKLDNTFARAKQLVQSAKY